jgi:Holliday junction resolvase RusA-like endonuclease
MVASDKWKKRPCVEQYWEYKDRLRGLFDAGDLPIPYFLIFVIPMPKSWSKKKRNKLKSKPCESTPDRDNLDKAFLDALFESDAHIYDGRTLKVWGETGRIVVYAIDPIPEEIIALHTNL